MDQYRVVSTDCGKLRGKLEIALFSEKQFYSFRGIPYAKPPLHKLRFKVKHIVVTLQIRNRYIQYNVLGPTTDRTVE